MPGEDWFLRAFWDLSTTRSYAMGCGPIPWNRIEDYGERIELDSSMMQVLHVVIRRLDRAFLDWTAKEQKRRAKAATKHSED